MHHPQIRIGALLLLACVLWLHASGQAIVITGQVTSANDGSPLPRVKVEIKGTNQSVTTDPKGHYQIRAAGNASLIFSLPGMKTTEMAVRNRNVINIAMEPVEMEARVEQVIVKLPGNVAWKSTGLVLRASDRVEFKATGEVCFSNGHPDSCVSPAGYPREHYWNDFPGDWEYCGDPVVGEEFGGVEGHAGLIAKDRNGLFFVGKDGVFTGKTGSLEIGINDCSLTGDYYNTGEFTVVIKVVRGGK